MHSRDQAEEIKISSQDDSWRPLSLSQVITVASSSPANGSHDVTMVQKKPPAMYAGYSETLFPAKYKNRWYLKDNEDEITTFYEVIGQECFRLCMPWHPKTRFVFKYDEMDPSVPVWEHVLSKDVPGFVSFGILKKQPASLKKLKANLKNHVYTGLGEVLLFCLFFNDCDLNDTNIGVNADCQITKLDGGMCFEELLSLDTIHQEGESYPIFRHHLKNLIFIKDFECENWLDPRGLFDKDFPNRSTFKHEVFRAILKLLVMPDKLLSDFVLSVVPQLMRKNPKHDVRTERLIEWLVDRKTELANAAKNLSGFKDYLRRGSSKKEILDYFESLKSFKIHGKRSLDVGLYMDEIHANLLTLKERGFLPRERRVITPTMVKS